MSAKGPLASDLGWDAFFTDPSLQAVIRLGLDHNLDLRLAALQVERAQAAFRIQRSSQSPSMSLQGASTNYRISEAEGSGQASVYRESTVHVASLSWELDLFGRIRSLKEEALNQYLSTEQVRRATRMSLVATLAQAFLQLGADTESLTLAARTLGAQTRTRELMDQSHALGAASDLEVAQARSQMESARVDLVRLQSQVAQDRHALDLLVGTTVPDRLLPRGMSAAPLADVRSDLSSEVLLARPDILAAEYQLRAAQADIGAARAAFFPRLSLTAGLGSMSPAVSGLFQGGTGTWLFTPNLTVPIFQGGALRANLASAKVSRDIALASYQRAIQSAFREVADGLTQRRALVDQNQAQEALTESLQRAFELSTARYRGGADSYLSVLVSQEAHLRAEQNLISTRLAQQLNRITLYKALGGGA